MKLGTFRPKIVAETDLGRNVPLPCRAGFYCRIIAHLSFTFDVVVDNNYSSYGQCFHYVVFESLNIII